MVKSTRSTNVTTGNLMLICDENLHKNIFSGFLDNSRRHGQLDGLTLGPNPSIIARVAMLL